MTVLEFLQQDEKDILKAFKEAGFKSRHDFECEDFSDGTLDILTIFMCRLGLEKGECEYGDGFDMRGGYTHVYFHFKYGFINNVSDESSRNDRSQHVEFDVYGTTVNKLKISPVQIKDNRMTIWDSNVDFIGDGRETHQFIFTVNVQTPLLKDILEFGKNQVELFTPHIKWIMETIRKGEYLEAQHRTNKVHYEDYPYIDRSVETARMSDYIRIHEYLFSTYGYDATILDCMVVNRYMCDNHLHKIEDFLSGIPNGHTHKEIVGDTIKSLYTKYVADERDEDNRVTIETVRSEFKKGIHDLIVNLSEKYGIHTSYFCYYSGADVHDQKCINCDLREPYERL